jgi:hypothetical protein
MNSLVRDADYAPTDIFGFDIAAYAAFENIPIVVLEPISTLPTLSADPNFKLGSIRAPRNL